MPILRNVAAWLLCVACAMAALPALELLARQQLRQHLDDVAAETLGALVHDSTPHQWSANVSTDIVAGRVFGTEDMAFVDDGLRMRSQGQPMQAGLVLDNAIDLARFALIDVAVTAEKAGTAALVVAESLGDPPCRSLEMPVPGGTSTLTMDLRSIGWMCKETRSAMPKRAAMLRLSFNMPTRSAITLQSVRARTRSGLDQASLVDLAMPLLPESDETVAFRRALARAAEDADQTIWPILQMPLDARVEQNLLARDRILDAIPDAAIVPQGDFDSILVKAESWHPDRTKSVSARIGWLLLGGYIALLVALRLKPPLDQRLRAMLELIASIAVPLIMVIGGYIGDNISPVVLGACAATLVFALSLLIGDAPAQPSARTLKRGWWVGLASLGLTAALVLDLTDGHISRELPEAARVFRYLAWAAVQQFLICVIVAERIERVSGSSRLALLGAALIFALLHTPNAMLMQLTFVAGLIWIWNWQRHRALLANIVAHATSGLLLAASLPPDWLHSAEVSARFFL
jgi:membrane protease YdiL (CAAX protease family)